MKSYFNEGLIHDYIINAIFNQMLNNHRTGTLKNILEVETKNFLKENDAVIFDYCYQLEGSINEYFHNSRKEDFRLKDACEYAMADYLKTVFHDNITTFMMNYAETLLYGYGLPAETINKINLYDFIEYYTEDTALESINAKVKKYIERLK